MAWNEPGKNDNDPWGNKNKNNQNDGPPDFDEILKNIFGKLSGGFGGGGGQSSHPNNSFTIVIALALFFLAAVYIVKGFGIVDAQEKAVVLRLGKFHEEKGPGLRWNPPLIDKVITENVTSVRVWSTDEQMLTKDLNIVDIKLSVQYSLDDAKDFILNVRNPEISLRQAANSALRHVVGSSHMHQVLTEGRTAISIETATNLQDYLNHYGAGIKIEKVNVEDANPPRQVQDAFDDVIKAREDEERFKNLAEGYVNDVIPRARGLAQRVLEEANAYKEQVEAKAVGESKRFELLLEQYTLAPEVTRKRLYLDAVESVMSNSSKIMVDVEGGNNMMYLPLDKIIESGTRASASAGAARAFTTTEMDQLVQGVTDQLRREGQTSARRGGR